MGKLIAFLCFCQVSFATIIEIDAGGDIQTAVDASAPNDTLLLNDGEYFGTVVTAEHSLTICSYFLFDNDSSHIESTLLAPDTVMDDTMSCLVVSHTDTGFVCIVGLTLQNGRGTAWGNSGVLSGGSLHVSRSNVRLKNCIIRDSQSFYGGAVLTYSNSVADYHGHLQMVECRIENCLSGQWGGGIYADCCSLTVTTSQFIGDTALADGGACIAFDCVSEIANCRFESCLGVTGGLHVAGGKSRVIGSTFIGNSAYGDLYWASHYASAQGHHEVEGCYFGYSGSLSRGFNFCCEPSDTICFRGNVVEGIVTTAPFGIGNFLISGVRGEFAYNIVQGNRTRGEQINTIGGTTIDIHHNYFVGNISDFPNRPSVLKIGVDPQQTFHDNAIIGNTGQTVGYTIDPGWIDARNNWWGDASGPYHPTRNPFGLGDTILADSVLFDPWLLEPPDTTQSAAERPGVPVRSTWKLLGAYPNPFNSQLTIELAGFTGNDFEIALFDVLGRRVETIARGAMIGGTLSYSVSPALASGIYFLVGTDRSAREAKKVVLMK